MDMHNTDVGHWALTLTTTDQATGVKTTVPVPAGDVFLAVSTSPSLAVTVANDAAGNQEVVGSPMVLQSDSGNGGGNIGFTVTDSAGDTAGEVTGINIITVPVVAQVTLGAPTFTTQPAPTAPGP